MKANLTIVIPTKNEERNISRVLDYLRRQKYIWGVKIIISDCSDDNTIKEIQKFQERFLDLNIIIINGGNTLAESLNKGAQLCDTKYILFLDADIYLKNTNVIWECYYNMQADDLDLGTCKIKSDKIFEISYIIRSIGQTISACISPFAKGFMMFKTSKFNELNGFNESYKFAADYQLSRKIKKSKFKIFPYQLYTPSIRFNKRSYRWLILMFFKSYYYRNNNEFFERIR